MLRKASSILPLMLLKYLLNLNNDSMKSGEAKGKLCLSETLPPGVSVMSECEKKKFRMLCYWHVIIHIYIQFILVHSKYSQKIEPLIKVK